MEVDAMLAMVRWLERTVKSFTYPGLRLQTSPLA
jgi:hypothetical protein